MVSATLNPFILYPLSNYTLGSKESQPEEDFSVNARLQRLTSDFNEFGMRKSVDSVLLSHQHGCVHILLFQVANAFFKLPGDYLQSDETDIEGLKKRLDQRLGHDRDGFNRDDVEIYEQESWQIGDLLGQWFRPNFESFMYPYLPAHIKTPKEIKSTYLIQLPETKILLIPNNMKLIGVPLFELYDNAVRYGPQLAAIPHLLSKYDFVMHE